MKNSLMNLYDKILLRKWAVIETVNDELKNICLIEHTRYRSIDNIVTDLIVGISADILGYGFPLMLFPCFASIILMKPVHQDFRIRR